VPSRTGRRSGTAARIRTTRGGNITAIGTETYAYDLVGRLTSGTSKGAGGNYSQTYEYDPFGNITQFATTTPAERNYWFRVYGGDGSCYTDSATLTAP